MVRQAPPGKPATAIMDRPDGQPGCRARRRLISRPDSRVRWCRPGVQHTAFVASAKMQPPYTANCPIAGFVNCAPVEHRRIAKFELQNTPPLG
jgi:hypothetical protein